MSIRGSKRRDLSDRLRYEIIRFTIDDQDSEEERDELMKKIRQKISFVVTTKEEEVIDDLAVELNCGGFGKLEEIKIEEIENG